MNLPKVLLDGLRKWRTQLAHGLLGMALLVAAFVAPHYAWAKDLTADEQAALEDRASKGDAAAMRDLGDALSVKDGRSALEWWKKALNAGANFSSGGRQWAFFRIGSDDARPFIEEDYRFFKVVVERSENPEYAAWFYKYGLGTPRDIPKAIALYTKQASMIGDDGKPANGEAMWELGDIYQNGYGVPIDLEKAVYWYRMALQTSYDELGWAGLMGIQDSGNYKLDEFTSEGGTKKAWKDHDVGPGLLIRANTFDSDLAMVLLGLNVADNETAIKYIERAVKRGYPPALNIMGLRYDEGKRGLAKDKKLACKYYLQAAQLNNLAAMLNLAVSEYNGDCGPRRPEVALKWLTVAADQKFADSFRQLGIIFRNQNLHEASLLNFYKARFANDKHDKLDQDIAREEKALSASKAQEIRATARREVLGDSGKSGDVLTSSTPATTTPPASKSNASISAIRPDDTAAPANQPANGCASLSNGSAVSVSVPGYPQRFSAMVLSTNAGKASVRVMQPTAPKGVSGRSFTVSCQSLVRAQ